MATYLMNLNLPDNLMAAYIYLKMYREQKISKDKIVGKLAWLRKATDAQMQSYTTRKSTLTKKWSQEKYLDFVYEEAQSIKDFTLDGFNLNISELLNAHRLLNQNLAFSIWKSKAKVLIEYLISEYSKGPKYYNNEPTTSDYYEIYKNFVSIFNPICSNRLKLLSEKELEDRFKEGYCCEDHDGPFIKIYALKWQNLMNSYKDEFAKNFSYKQQLI